jgi:2-succinyl-5-enolpyruvyl-6-hydroxy-3-cyclohexene-1-carboxylate synthase
VARDDVSTTGDANLARATALVDALVAGGVRHACLSPGSRSTPIALALARHPAIELQVHLDERSSAFVALGIGKATGIPTIVACTSGTAAAEFLPAVVEASQARVPMVVLTADRPPRLRGTGANQTIDQVELYGGYVRRFAGASLDGSAQAWAAAGAEAIPAATGDPPGPVHLNLPFDEPLVPEARAGLAGRAVADVVRVTRAWPRPSPAEPTSLEPPDALDLVRTDQPLDEARGLVVAGATSSHADAILELAGRLGWPVVAEPLSGLRRPAGALAAGQHLLASDPWTAAHRPEVVLQVGAAPTTRVTQRLVASSDRLIVLDRVHVDPDPDHRATLRVAADPNAIARALLAVVPDHPSSEGETWRAAWERADAVARDAIDRTLDGWDEPFEGRIARDVAAAIPGGGCLFVGNSMPVRDLDAFMSPRDGLRVLANRGASGIDGLVSTALGIAAGGERIGPTVALLGDLSLLHDAGALLWNGSRDLDLVLIVPNNDGGGVFDFTGQGALPEFERLFLTPHGLDLGGLAEAARIPHVRAERAAELVPALRDAIAGGGIRLLEVPIDRTANVTRHAEVQAAVDAALA